MSKERNKQQYKKARDLGLSSAQAKKYYNYSTKRFQAEYKTEKKKFQEEHKKVKQEQYNRTRREKYNEARKSGLNSEEAQSYRSRKKSNIDAFKKELLDREFMVIGYREFTHGDDPEAYYEMKRTNRSASAKELTDVITDMLTTSQEKGGFIGDYRIDIVQGDEELHRLKMLYRETEYIPMYIGEGKSLPPILSIISIALGVMYRDMCKFLILEIIENLRMLHNEKAHKNADYLEKMFIPVLRGEAII